MFLSAKSEMVNPAEALPGSSQPMQIENRHFVLGASLLPPYPDHLAQAVFGMGCFWGAERKFWSLSGVYSTAVGYCGGYTPNPDYREVCSGKTGHTEAVSVIYDPQKISFENLLVVFWESHDPTQGMRQGNDRGTQYRSGIYILDESQQDSAHSSLAAYQAALSARGMATITTEIKPLEDFFFAEDYHQQYLAKNPGGYCGLGGTGVSYCS